MLSSPDEGGPFEVVHRLRDWAGVEYDDHGNMAVEPGSLADGLICIKCNTVWLGLLFTLLYKLSPRLALFIALPFALSGVGLLIELR